MVQQVPELAHCVLRQKAETTILVCRGMSIQQLNPEGD